MGLIDMITSHVQDTAETAATPDPSIIPKAANHSPLECAILFTVELSRTQASVGDVVENDVVSRMMRLVDATDSDTGVTMQRVRKELDEGRYGVYNDA